MSVDYTDCARCGESICDCGDDWNYCSECGRIICNDCLVKPWEEDEETGDMSKECCPYCSGTEVHNNDLLEFLLKRDNMTREVAVELYKEVEDEHQNKCGKTIEEIMEEQRKDIGLLLHEILLEIEGGIASFSKVDDIAKKYEYTPMDDGFIDVREVE